MKAYAVNRLTKEHRRADTIAWQCRYGNDWLIVEADAEGWITKTDGYPPVPKGVRVDVRLGDGREKHNLDAYNLGWFLDGLSGGIAFYRPILEDKEQDMSEQEWQVGDLVDGDNGGGMAYEIVSMSGSTAWLRDRDRPQSKGVLYPIENMQPYRTAAQRAEDEAVTRIQTESQDSMGGPISTGAALRIYRAIRDGRIPGVKVEGE